jgi:hypothetical protein
MAGVKLFFAFLIQALDKVVFKVSQYQCNQSMNRLAVDAIVSLLHPSDIRSLPAPPFGKHHIQQAPAHPKNMV